MWLGWARREAGGREGRGWRERDRDEGGEGGLRWDSSETFLFLGPRGERAGSAILPHGRHLKLAF